MQPQTYNTKLYLVKVARQQEETHKHGDAVAF